MTWLGLARAVVRILTVVVLVVSGAYLLIYLYRWEWNRALISGIFLLVALIVLSTTMVLRRLSRIDQRLEAARREWATEVHRQVRTASDARAGRHFEWLRRPPDRLSVFVPVLLGAGALLSGLAYLIERIAGVIASRTVDRPLSSGLAGAMPLGAVGGPAPGAPPPGRRSAPNPIVAGLGLVVVGGLITVAVLVIRDATQNRTETGVEAGATVIHLDIDQKRPEIAAEEAGEALWVACRNRASPTADAPSIAEVGPGHVRMIVDEGMGPLRRRRLFGCLEDATLDLVSAEVTAFELIRADPVPDS